MSSKVSQKYRITSQQIISASNFKKGITNPSTAYTALKGQIIDRLVAGDYTSQYLSITDGGFQEAPSDLEDDPMGEWQFEFLKREGLATDDYLLDIGCGYLRGGLRFIRYLEDGQYYGMDISEDALAEAEQTMETYGLAPMSPTLFNNSDLRFQDDELGEQKFDFALAQSVFTHLPPAEIEECLSNLGNLLERDGTLLATYHASPDETVKKFARAADFGYPFEFFEDLAREYGLRIVELESDHPKGHNLLRITLAE